MFDQTLFNMLVGVTGFLGGFWLNTLWNEVKALRKTDVEIAEKVNSIEVLVAGNYVKRAEFESHMTQVYNLLRRIEDKLDSKVDKAGRS